MGITACPRCNVLATWQLKAVGHDYTGRRMVRCPVVQARATAAGGQTSNTECPHLKSAIAAAVARYRARRS